MGIFGRLDAATIPSNPFKIDEGVYSATITNAQYRDNQTKNVRQLIIEFTIDDEDSSFLDYKAPMYFDLVDSEMTAEMFELLPATEKQKIQRALASLKKTLCGDGRHKGLAIDENDLNDPDWDPKSLINLKTTIGISNYGPNKENFNVRWANIREE